MSQVTKQAPIKTTLGPTASLQYTDGFIPWEESSELLTRWTAELDWIRSNINLFGRKIPIPRLNAWYGDRAYAYSGTRFEAKSWTPELKLIKNRVELASGLRFNSVLLNLYRDGQDTMGWHSDDEKSLGNNPQIASVSLGACRRFVLREKNNKKNKHSMMLGDGSLLLMLGETQKLWQHSLPRTRAAASMKSRINLTFRQID